MFHTNDVHFVKKSGKKWSSEKENETKDEHKDTNIEGQVGQQGHTGFLVFRILARKSFFCSVDVICKCWTQFNGI